MALRYDIIAFDLDGTLTPSKSPLEQETAQILMRLLEQFKVAVISGASYDQFQHQFLSHLPCSVELLKNLFLLPTDGAMYCEYNNSSWKCAHEYSFTGEEKQKIYDAFEKTFAETGFIKPEKTYGNLIEDRISQVTFSAYGMDAPLELKKTWDPDHTKRQKMLRILQPLLPEFSAHIGGTTSIDVTKAGVDKGYGLKNLLKKLNVPPERMLYLGDELFPDGNDAPAKTVGAVCIQVSGPVETRKILSDLLNDKTPTP